MQFLESLTPDENDQNIYGTKCDLIWNNTCNLTYNSEISAFDDFPYDRPLDEQDYTFIRKNDDLKINENSSSLKEETINSIYNSPNDHFPIYLNIKDENIKQNLQFSRMFNNIVFDPKTMIFIPSKIFNKKSYTFTEICEEHFQGRSSKKLRFEYKLWNALQITKVYPSLYIFVGVVWLNDKVIKVHRHYFGNLLKLKRPTSALFTSQGSCPSHGFLELSINELKKDYGIEALPNDFSNCRYFYRPDGTFSSNSTENDVLSCKWIRPPNQ